MVSYMEETVKIDSKGRLVLPAHIRLDDPRVITESTFQDIDKKVEKWKETALRLKSKALTEDVEEEWKWMSREYAKRKLSV